MAERWLVLGPRPIGSTYWWVLELIAITSLGQWEAREGTGPVFRAAPARASQLLAKINVMKYFLNTHNISFGPAKIIAPQRQHASLRVELAYRSAERALAIGPGLRPAPPSSSAYFFNSPINATNSQRAEPPRRKLRLL